MDLSTRVLGKNVADAIAARNASAVLTIGRDRFLRRDLTLTGCFNFTAASILNAVFGELKPSDTRDVFNNYPPTSLVLPRVGSVSPAVLGAAFEHKGLGGDHPLESWMLRHRGNEAREYVTFHSLKEAERKREAGEVRAKKTRRERKARRRDQAQRLRGERFIERREGTVTDGTE